MLEEAFALLSDHFFLAGALGLAAIAGAMAEKLRAAHARRTWRSRNPDKWNNKRDRKPIPGQSSQFAPSLVPARVMDAADQLRIVMNAEFKSQPLLNRSEARVFRELDHIVLSYNPSWQVMAQVSLGEILRTDDQVAYGCINAKRVDLLLVDEQCHPRHVVEYQGAGHHQGSAAARDAVKKEALRQAGVGYHEVVAGHTKPSELRRLMERLVDKTSSGDVVREAPAVPFAASHPLGGSTSVPEAQPSR